MSLYRKGSAITGTPSGFSQFTWNTPGRQYDSMGHAPAQMTIGLAGGPTANPRATAGGNTWEMNGQDAQGNHFGGQGGFFGMNPYGSQDRIGNKGGVMAPPSPNALEANGRPGMGSMDDFYAARATDPITGGSLRPSDYQNLQERASMQRRGDYEGLGAVDAYRGGRSSNNPYMAMAGAQEIQAIRARRAYGAARAAGRPHNSFDDAPGPNEKMGLNGAIIPREMGGPVRQSPREGVFDEQGGIHMDSRLDPPGTTAMNVLGATSYYVPGMASGGHANSYNPYLVGEKGPEIYVSKNGDAEILGLPGAEIRTFGEEGTIIPNHKIKAMEHGGHVRKSPFNWFSFLNRPQDEFETPEWKSEMDQYNKSSPIIRGLYNVGDSMLGAAKGLGRAAAWPFTPTPYLGPERPPLGPSMFANRQRGFDDALRLNPYAAAFANQPQIADTGIRHDPEAEAARRAALSRHSNDRFYPKYENPYDKLPIDQQMMIAAMDRKQGIISRGQKGDVTFDNGGGIATGADGERVAYGPHVVSRQAPVKFTRGHVRDERGDMAGPEPKSPASPSKPPQLTEPGPLAKKAQKTVDEINQTIADIKSGKSPAQRMSGRELENEIGLPHLGDPGTMTGVPMAPKAPNLPAGFLANGLPKLSNPYVAGGYGEEPDLFAGVKPAGGPIQPLDYDPFSPPHQFSYDETPASKLWPNPPLSPMSLAIQESQRGLSAYPEQYAPNQIPGRTLPSINTPSNTEGMNKLGEFIRSLQDNRIAPSTIPRNPYSEDQRQAQGLPGWPVAPNIDWDLNPVNYGRKTRMASTFSKQDA